MSSSFCERTEARRVRQTGQVRQARAIRIEARAAGDSVAGRPPPSRTVLCAPIARSNDRMQQIMPASRTILLYWNGAPIGKPKSEHRPLLQQNRLPAPRTADSHRPNRIHAEDDDHNDDHQPIHECSHQKRHYLEKQERRVQASQPAYGWLHGPLLEGMLAPHQG